jgi:hypothetical protein
VAGGSSSPTGPLVIAGAGVLLLYSGIRGKGFLSALRGLLHGQAPSAAAAANQITGTPASATGSAGTAGSQAPIAASASQAVFIAAVLTGIGAPDTAANQASLVHWMEQEEPQSDWNHWNNPLNTTQAEPGSSPENSVSVQSFPSLTEGLAATIATLLNGNYPDILLQLRAGNGLQSGASAGLLKWSGGAYSSA